MSGKAGNIGGQLFAGGNRFEGARSSEFPNRPLQRTAAGEIFVAAGRLGHKPFPLPASNASALVLSAPALAASTDDSGKSAPASTATGDVIDNPADTELVVTGRRDQATAEVQKTPVSITSLSGDKLSQQGITTGPDRGLPIYRTAKYNDPRTVLFTVAYHNQRSRRRPPRPNGPAGGL